MQLFYKLPLTAAVLAGGKSTRMKTQKCLLTVNNKKIVDILIEKLKNTFEEILIITNFPELFFYLGLPLIGDIYPFKGPMAGIHAAMKNSKYDVFVFACDMPFVREEIIFKLYEKHLSEKYDATVCSFNQKIYPLPGIYSKVLFPYLEKMLSEDKLSMSILLSDVHSQIIDVANLDHKGLSFININTQEDLENFQKGGIKCLD